MFGNDKRINIGIMIFRGESHENLNKIIVEQEMKRVKEYTKHKGHSS